MADNHSITKELNMLVKKARRAFRGLIKKEIITSVLVAFAVFFVCFLVIILAEQALYLSPFIKTVLLVLTLLCSFSTGTFYYKKKTSQSFSEFYSKFAEFSSQPELKYAFDLKEHPRNENSRFFTLALQKNIEQISLKSFSNGLNNYVHNQSAHKKFVSFSLISLFLLISVVAAVFIAGGSFSRTLNFWQTYTPPNPYSFQITPGHVTLQQGKDFMPTIQFDGDTPDELVLAVKTDVENTYRKRSPVKKEGSMFEFSPLSLSADATYYFEMDGYKSATFKATFQLLPRFQRLTIQVDPPAYTQLNSTLYTYPSSNIQAYRGSKITFTGTTNKAIASLFLIQKNKNDSLSINSKTAREFEHPWIYTQQDTVQFSMLDKTGLNNENPFEFILRSIQDEYPFVQLLSPEENIEQKNPGKLQLEYQTDDDFGISSTSLHYSIQSAFGDAEALEKTIQLPADASTARYDWNLKSLNLKPRDVLTFWIETSDNDGFQGAKTSSSRKFTLSVPSVTEYLDELDNKEDDLDRTLDDVSESYQQMQNEYERFKEDMKQNPEQNYEQQQRLKNVEERQNEVQEKVDELNKKFEKIRSEISRDSLMSKETMNAYKELKQLMKEIDDPALQKALEELQESMGKLSPQELRQAMENFEFNEQRYQERIERTLELFKQLKLNSDLDKLAKAFDELARQEKELSESKSDPGSNQSERQQAIQQDARQMQNKLNELSENAPKKSASQIEKLQEDASGELKKVDENLKQNIQELQKGNLSPNNQNQIKQQQKNIEQQFRQLSQQMNSAQKSMQQQQAQINISALQYILYSMIDLSEHQEKLTQKTQNLTSRSQGFVKKARKQQNIQQQFSNISDSLFVISKTVPQFSNTINQKKAQVVQQLAASVTQLAERNKSNATFNQRQSLGGMNEIASMIASLLQQLQDAKSGAGGGAMSMQQLMEQMQKMSGQQQQLNEQIQNYINDIQGNRLSNDQIERLNQMARQQNAIRKQLREMQRGGQLQDGDRVLSELERMAEQMEDTINDLRGGQTNELLIERQQNILSRMLNAEKALQERGKEEQREATTAEDVPKRVPPDVTIEELKKRIRKLLNDPKQTPYNDDYQKLIEQYFKLLQELEQDGQ